MSMSMSMSDYTYHIVDVFTDTRFGGNQLAVIPDARGLDSETMQRIAREFNYSETTFVLPPEVASHTAHFRIFTPVRELPFAGHPTVGTAWVLGQERGLPAGSELVLEAGVGLLKVALSEHGARFQVAVQPEFGNLDVSRHDLARMLGLQADDLAGEAAVASCGIPFALVPLSGLDALRRARLSLAGDDALFQRWPALGKLYLYSRESEVADADLQTRMFGPSVGVPEDPATGSAASALAAWLAEREPGDGSYRRVIAQGLEMGRPSRIETEVLRQQGQYQVFVAGGVVPFSRGRISL